MPDRPAAQTNPTSRPSHNTPSPSTPSPDTPSPSTPTANTPASNAPASRTPWRTDLVATCAAVVCAMIAWVFVSALPGVDLIVDAGGSPRHVGPVDVVVAAGISALAGFCLLRLLQRVSRHGLVPWTVVAAVVAVGSLLGTTAAQTRPAMFALMSLHTVVAAVVLASAWRSRS